MGVAWHFSGELGIGWGEPSCIHDYFNPDAARVYPKDELGVAGGEPSSNLGGG